MGAGALKTSACHLVANNDKIAVRGSKGQQTCQLPNACNLAHDATKEGISSANQKLSPGIDSDFPK
jgi:hypothetical protein